jgi:hypothetical protein
MAEVRATTIAPEVTPTGVVSHEDENIWFLVRRRNRSDYAQERSHGYKQPQAVID